MKTVIFHLMKVLVQRFYIINAGFFLFLFFMFFGIVYGGLLIAYHRSLIMGMITSPVFMGMVWIGWLLYNIKCIVFCTTAIKAPDSTYIYALKALPPVQQLPAYLLVSTMTYLPVLGYSFFVVYLAFTQSLPVMALSVIAYQLLMITLGAGVLFISINKNRLPLVLEKLAAIFALWKWVRLGYFAFLPGYLAHSRKLAFLVTKIFSILLLSVSFVRNGDHFDADLFSIFFQLIFIAHALLVFYCVDFSETQLQFTRNLPLALPKVTVMYLLTYVLLLLPDTAFMIINNHSNLPFSEILILSGTAVATLFLYTAVLYTCGLNMDNYLLLVFVIFLMLFFVQKIELHLLTMIAVLVTAIFIFRSSYYSFEREV